MTLTYFIGLVALTASATAAGLRGSSQQSSGNVAEVTRVSEYTSKRGVLNVTLELDAHTYDQGNLSFVTRAFNGQIPGPTIRVFPGDRLILTLKNKLQNNLDATTQQNVLLSNSNGQSTAPFQNANSTNLHTHGLHVSPLLGSDNVMDVNVGPGESYQYIYDIPADHMPGTFWYHTHLHGSTMLQTGGGASGMLMVDAPPPAKASYPEWLKEITDPKREQIMMINTIPFSALRAVSEYSSPSGAPTLPTSGHSLFQVSTQTSDHLPAGWNITSTPIDANNQYQSGPKPGDVPPGNASTITNIALVNGKHVPEMKLQSGEWQQWKLLHAGPFFYMDLTLEPEGSEAETEAGMPTPKCEMQLLAKDGIYLDILPRVVDRLVLPPAGRADVAVRCVGAGKLRLVSGARPGSSGKWSNDLYWNPTIATVQVAAASKDQAAAAAVTPTPYQMQRPAYLQTLVGAPASDMHGTFDMRFDGKGVKTVKADDSPMYPHDGTKGSTCLINGLTFDRNTPVGRMKLNTMQEWSMGNVAGHPLHLHVNPFQMTEIVGSMYSPSAHSYCDKEYGYTCVGDWIDTLQLPTAEVGGSSDSKFRFVTDTFTGHEVMHCHYLNHEDTGCMTYFDIEL